MAVELKFRRKGEVITVEFPRGSVPRQIHPPEELDGMDLTGYPVIYFKSGSKWAKDKAQNIAAEAPNCLVVYQFSWRNGYGEGILLPKDFNPTRLGYYKTESRKEREAKEARKAAELAERQAENEANKTWHGEIRQQIEAEFPGLFRFYSPRHGRIGLHYKGSGFSEDWDVVGASIEEVRTEVTSRLPVWSEWNSRVQEVLTRYYGENPPHEDVGLKPCPFVDPETNQITLTWGVKPRYSVTLSKQIDGAWVVVGDEPSLTPPRPEPEPEVVEPKFQIPSDIEWRILETVLKLRPEANEKQLGDSVYDWGFEMRESNPEALATNEIQTLAEMFLEQLGEN